MGLTPQQTEAFERYLFFPGHIRRFQRPEYIAHRDSTPIECLPADCLLADYPVALPWRDGTPAPALKSALAG